ncbi:hypothetical protein KAJ27_22440 [bacterium]|nr:hypothetical protein [bacterium]
MNKIFHCNVAQLIEKLKLFPQDAPVLVSGYENGFENFSDPVVVKVVHKSDADYWDGEFQETEASDNDVTEIIVLRRLVRYV